MTDKPMTPERLEELRAIWKDDQTSVVNELLAEIDRRGAALEKAEAERDDLQTVFDFQWKANQRAIKAWQEAHPGNDMVWPDRAKMVIWLMEQYAAARAALEKAREENARLRAPLDEALKEIGHSSDCATHNAPALPSGQCDCWVSKFLTARSLKEPTP